MQTPMQMQTAAALGYEAQCLRRELDQEARDALQERIDRRAEEIAAQMVSDPQLPVAAEALRDALEASEFDEAALDMLHMLFWGAPAADTCMTAFKWRLQQLAALDGNVMAVAIKQAEMELTP